MPLPSTPLAAAQAQLEEFCASSTPVAVRELQRFEYTVLDDELTLVEHRAPTEDDATEWSTRNVAMFRFDADEALWTLMWVGATGEWDEYPNLKPVADFAIALREVDQDPIAGFFG